MEILWNRFKKWLDENAPDLLSSLNKGATEEDLNKLEKIIGKDLPSDFKEFYKIHNGQDRDSAYLIDCQELLSIDRIIEEWQVWKGLLDSKDFEEDRVPYTSEPDKGIKNDWWNRYWIPITYDGSGNHVCLDLDPSTEGTNGQMITMWHDSAERELLSNSFKEWWAEYIKGLENGEYIYSEDWGGIINKEDAQYE